MPGAQRTFQCGLSAALPEFLLADGADHDRAEVVTVALLLEDGGAPDLDVVGRVTGGAVVVVYDAVAEHACLTLEHFAVVGVKDAMALVGDVAGEGAIPIVNEANVLQAAALVDKGDRLAGGHVGELLIAFREVPVVGELVGAKVPRRPDLGVVRELVLHRQSGDVTEVFLDLAERPLKQRLPGTVSRRVR